MAIKIFQPGQVQEKGLPGVRQRISVDERDFGGELAGAIGRAGSDVARTAAVFQREKQRQLKAREHGFRADLGAITQQHMEPMLTLKGQDALKWGDKAHEKYDKALDDHLASVQDEDQRELLRPHVTEQKTLFRQNRAEFLAKQGGVLRQQKLEALTSQARKMARDGARLGFKENIRVAIEVNRDAVRGWADDEGIEGLALNKLLQDATSPLYADVVATYAENGDANAAEAAFDTYKDSMTEKARDATGKVVMGAVAVDEATQLVTTLKADDPNQDDNVDLEEALGILGGQGYSPEKQRAVGDELVRQVKLNDAARDAADAPHKDILLSELATTGRINRNSREYQSLHLAGKAFIDTKARLRSETSKSARSKANRLLYLKYRNLNAAARRGIDIDTHPVFGLADDITREEMKYLSRVFDRDEVTERHAKTLASESFFRKNTGRSSSWLEKNQDRYMDQFLSKYARYTVNNPGLKPSESLVDSWAEELNRDIVLEDYSSVFYMDVTKRYWMLSPKEREDYADQELKKVGIEVSANESATRRYEQLRDQKLKDQHEATPDRSAAPPSGKVRIVKDGQYKMIPADKIEEFKKLMEPKGWRLVNE